jgi:hypothetical protein
MAAGSEEAGYSRRLEVPGPPLVWASIFQLGEGPFRSFGEKGRVVDCRTASSVGTGFLEKPGGNALFAGEHTSTHSQGYLNGGVETGERAARQVLNVLG